MLAPDVRQQLQRVAIARIDPRQDQVDALPLHQPDRHPIIGGLFDDMPQRLQHRSQQGQSRGIGVEDQDSELVHGFLSLHGMNRRAEGRGRRGSLPPIPYPGGNRPEG